ncbi:MAG: alanyl-tRNA editing protein [Pseudomonadota bacterium]
MTHALYRADAYRSQAPATVAAITERGGICLDASLFYPTSGGQTGDGGRLSWDGGAAEIVLTIKDGEDTVLVPAEGATLPQVGTKITQTLDWARRYRCMRLHTGLHLLSVVIPLPVTGGHITQEKGRLDFDMPDAPGDKQDIEDQLNALVEADAPVAEEWITDAELDADPGLVKTLSVQPPRGTGQVRLVRIGGEQQIDLQPCGGTHVRSTAEVGRLRLGKIEKKGRRNRRVSVTLEDPDRPHE